jgi:hypothetical protein
MKTAIDILKKAKRQARKQMFFSRITMNWFLVERKRAEINEINEAIKLLEKE